MALCIASEKQNRASGFYDLFSQSVQRLCLAVQCKYEIHYSTPIHLLDTLKMKLSSPVKDHFCKWW